MTNEELVSFIQKGINPTENMEKLYRQNYGFIVRIIKRYSSGNQTEDLAQVAYFGLYKAAMMFNSTMKVKFITYASHWIRQVIIRYQEEYGHSIKIPSYLQSRIMHYKKMQTSYEMQKGYKPSDEEVCCSMGISLKTLSEIKKAEQINYISSLDESVPEKEDVLLEDCVADPNVDVENSIIDSMMKGKIQTDLWQIAEGNVNQNEYRVLILRYRENMTLEVISRELCISRERVRQIEINALRKLSSTRIKRMLSRRFGVGEV
jgi:RNA polymerase sigma factor (sigma-70 family)